MIQHGVCGTRQASLLPAAFLGLDAGQLFRALGPSLVSMGALDLLWHLFNLFAVALLFGAIVAAGAKLLWRQPLAAVAWLRLAGLLALVAGAVTLAGLLAFGRDGRMATYALMVVAAAAALAWVARRRRL